ncbi:hypothetical protein [Streptomyces noursei]
MAEKAEQEAEAEAVVVGVACRPDRSLRAPTISMSSAVETGREPP